MSKVKILFIVKKENEQLNYGILVLVEAFTVSVLKPTDLFSKKKKKLQQVE